MKINDENKELRFIELGKDTTVKYLYKNEETRKWFHRIIKEKLNLDLENYVLIDNELNTGNQRKDYRLDLNLQKEDTVVIIEMNYSHYQFQEAKNYQYLYRIAGKRFIEGENYHPTQTKLIILNDFYCPTKKNASIIHYEFMDPELDLKNEDIESYEIYLPIFKNACYNPSFVV